MPRFVSGRCLRFVPRCGSPAHGAEVPQRAQRSLRRRHASSWRPRLPKPKARAEALAFAARARIADADHARRRRLSRLPDPRRADAQRPRSSAIPNCAEGYIQLAIAIGFRGRLVSAFEAQSEGLAERGRAAIDKALELDPRTFWARASLGGWHLGNRPPRRPDPRRASLYGAQRGRRPQDFSRGARGRSGQPARPLSLRALDPGSRRRKISAPKRRNARTTAQRPAHRRADSPSRASAPTSFANC